MHHLNMIYYAIKEAKCVLFKSDGHFTGFATGEDRQLHGEKVRDIDLFYVRVEWRHKGIGTAAVDALLRSARESKTDAVIVAPSRDRMAWAFWRGCNFEFMKNNKAVDEKQTAEMDKALEEPGVSLASTDKACYRITPWRTTPFPPDKDGQHM